MLIPYSQPRFVEKVISDRSGRQFRMIFLVALVDGEVKGRLISIEPVISSFRSAECVACLPTVAAKKIAETEYVSAFAPTVSPYFSLEFLINSQPTRAPAYK